jgi:hypothetical protein
MRTPVTYRINVVAVVKNTYFMLFRIENILIISQARGPCGQNLF